jgi:DmsE family decaheme c-type cytochrome
MRVLRSVLLFFCLLAFFVTIAPYASDAGESECAMCHEDVVTAFERNAHAGAPGWDMATACQSCHGPGEAHIEGGGDLDAIIRPQLLPKRESSDGCLSCHERHEKQFSGRRSNHRLNDVGCLDCHAPHHAGDNMLREEGADLCAGCHQSIAARMDLPRSHPMATGGPGCVECHEPHAARALRANPTSTARVCAECHFEKAGPFVYDHGMLIDGCSSCHETHGSSNRHLLKHESQVNLCYECHGASVTPGWHSAPGFAGQKCTTCHTAIHGSNSSQLFLED